METYQQVMPHLVMSLYYSSIMQIHFRSISKFDMYKNSSGIANPTFLGMTVNDECVNLVVETNMEGSTLILIQPETTTILTTIAPSIVTII
jgi:hypothetical protein